MTRYLGRYLVGTELPMIFRATKGGASDIPLTHPTFEFRTAAMALIQATRVPADDQGVIVGMFRGPLFLGAQFPVGRVWIFVRWADSDGVPRVETQAVDIAPGGNPDGAVIALHTVERPNALNLISLTDAGLLVRGINPR